MKSKIVELARAELHRRWFLLRARVCSSAVNRAFPLLKGWMVRNDPWKFSNYPSKVVDLHTLKGRLRQKLSYFLWDHTSDSNLQDVMMTQMFVVPTEWNCDRQVDIEARIHGLPVVDPEQPFTKEPKREVLDPNGTSFKVVMKRAPAPKIPKPGRTAKKRAPKRAA